MSVKGEFLRISAEAVTCLRAGSGAAHRLADDLEAIRRGAAEDLSAAAGSVLERFHEARDAALALDDETRAQLDDASERLLAIARIILGHRPS